MAAGSGRQSNIQSATTMDRLVAEGLAHVTTLNAIMHTRHDFMVHERRRQTIPSNPEYSVPQLRVWGNAGQFHASFQRSHIKAHPMSPLMPCVAEREAVISSHERYRDHE